VQQHTQVLLQRFCLTASTAFLDAYHAVVEESTRASVEKADSKPEAVPVTAKGENRERYLLDLALFEKAAYEVCYEAAHRPDWISIPLAGMVRAGRRLLRNSDEGNTDD
jgi:maltose alpha-D-glucosyltransferase/alpha-amylase